MGWGQGQKERIKRYILLAFVSQSSVPIVFLIPSTLNHPHNTFKMRLLTAATIIAQVALATLAIAAPSDNMEVSSLTKRIE